MHDTDKENSRKTSPGATLSTTIFSWTGLGSNPGLRGEIQRPVGVCVASNLNTLLQFISAAGTTVGGMREAEVETNQKVKRRLNGWNMLEKATQYPYFEFIRKDYYEEVLISP